MITPSDIARGSHPPQRGTLVGTCNGGKYSCRLLVVDKFVIAVKASNAGGIIDVRYVTSILIATKQLGCSGPEILGL